jgi:hypothetical protein
MTGGSLITRRTLALGAAAVVVAVYSVLPGLTDTLAYLAPALLLLLVLATRRYPGERALMALMKGRGGARRHGHAEDHAQLARPRAVVPRGGSLIATSLAVRPPPARRTAALS